MQEATDNAQTKIKRLFQNLWKDKLNPSPEEEIHPWNFFLIKFKNIEGIAFVED